MARRYKLKRRAQRQEETRRRIVAAAYELHGSVGPAATTITAIAARAGVRRLTVYRHFPDERSLYRACTQYALRANPPPDPTPWQLIDDPEARLRTALTEFYAYYRRVEPVLANVLRDAERVSALQEALAEGFASYLAQAQRTLVAGLARRAEHHAPVRAAVGLALDFGAWRTLTRRQGLTDEQAVDLMVDLIRCAAQTPTPGRDRRGRGSGASP